MLIRKKLMNNSGINLKKQLKKYGNINQKLFFLENSVIDLKDNCKNLIYRKKNGSKRYDKMKHKNLLVLSKEATPNVLRSNSRKELKVSTTENLVVRANYNYSIESNKKLRIKL